MAKITNVTQLIKLACDNASLWNCRHEEYKLREETGGLESD